MEIMSHIGFKWGKYTYEGEIYGNLNNVYRIIVEKSTNPEYTEEILAARKVTRYISQKNKTIYIVEHEEQ